MNTSSIFWGVFFICFGFFFLLQKLNACDLVYSSFLDYWPIIIILWGISILKLPELIKKLLAVISAIFLAVLLMALINHSWFPFNCSDDDNDFSDKSKIEKEFKDVIEIPYSETYKFASLELNAGACSLDFKDSTDKLIETFSGYPAVNLDYVIKESEEHVNLKLDLNFKAKLFKKKKSNKVWVKLNTHPVWDFDFDIGAVNIDCDYSKYKIRDFCVDVGAADVEIKLGDLYKSTYLEINAGA